LQDESEKDDHDLPSLKARRNGEIKKRRKGFKWRDMEGKGWRKSYELKKIVLDHTPKG